MIFQNSAELKNGVAPRLLWGIVELWERDIFIVLNRLWKYLIIFTIIVVGNFGENFGEHFDDIVSALSHNVPDIIPLNELCRIVLGW